MPATRHGNVIGNKHYMMLLLLLLQKAVPTGSFNAGT